MAHHPPHWTRQCGLAALIMAALIQPAAAGAGGSGSVRRALRADELQAAQTVEKNHYFPGLTDEAAQTAEKDHYFPGFHPRMHTAHNNDVNGPFFHRGV